MTSNYQTNSVQVGSATLFGVTVLENLRYDNNDNPKFTKQLVFDAQLTSKSGETLIGAFRYWNEKNTPFKTDGIVGKYMIAATITQIYPDANIRPIQNGLAILDYHIVGDIIWMQELPLTDDDMFDPPLITASGYVVSVENNMDTFTLESYPWTSVFKVNRKLPIHVEFDRDLRRFKERRPMPSVGRIVSVCGMLSGFHLEGGADTNARLTAFTIDIQEISFLSTVPQTAPANDSSSPTPLTPHRGLRYGMRSRANPRSGDRGRALPPTMQTLTMPSSPSPSFLPQLADGIVGTGLPTDPSTPPNVISEAGLGLTERTHNLRKRKKRKDDDEVANVAGGSSSLSGSSISTESTLSESVYSESTHIMDSNA